MFVSWYLPRFLFSGGVIDSDEHGLFYGPGDTLGLPVHEGKIVKFDGMTHGVTAVVDGGGDS